MFDLWLRMALLMDLSTEGLDGRSRFIILSPTERLYHKIKRVGFYLKIS